MNNKWNNKQARDLFAKAVNSILMSDISKIKDIDFVIEVAKKITDKAFEYYGDTDESETIIEDNQEELPL